jgi:hypothetical protein
VFTFTINPLFFVKGETHVEGHIIQDTVWTLTDSPFVVIKDLFIDVGATLTIEPGVEVRFGGNFSLVVRGKLIADGTVEKPITFTSNKLQPERGDWVAINFTSMQPSHLEYCIIEYAENGIAIENGNLIIARSNITNNLQNGVYITGDNSASINENRIENNKNGIFVNGNSSGTIIQRNYIYFNNETGIRLFTTNSTQIENILILNNILSTNPKGINVYGRVNANIMRNSIAYNELGILYENATNIIPLHYNDFYGNTLGAEALSSNPVDAEHNYWGDRGGPYHVSLNPYGKGNPVESNGTDLDFIPFLTINNSYVNQRPIANLLTNKLRVAPNDNVTFIGTLSEDDRQAYRYFFNFGDGKNSDWITLSIFKHKYYSEGTYIATLTVMDDFGVTSENTATAVISVTNLAPLNVQLELGSYTIEYGESTSITVQVTDGVNPVEGANITFISVKGGTVQPKSGLTNPTGYFTSNFTAPNPSSMSNIRIIATASRDGYADGSDYRYLRVLPPLLIELIIDNPEIESEEATIIRVHATYHGENLTDAYVQMQFTIDGNISQTTGYTDVDGVASFDFTAPQTLVSINVTVTAIISKIGYASEEAQTQITVNPRKLDISITAEPSTVASEETTVITVLVTHKGTSIADNATVQLHFNINGNISETSGYTNNGTATFAFTAPPTSVNSTVDITATASVNGYKPAETQAQILVVPKIFGISITTTPNIISSEETTAITLHATYNGTPVAHANVTILSDGEGEFDFVTKYTGEAGNATFIFTAPLVTERTNITITATITQPGYALRNGIATIVVERGILEVTVVPNLYLIASEKTSNVTVYVRRNGKPVSDANVSITATSGIFSETTGLTNSNGYCTFLFTAPKTTSEISISILANSTKLGYISAETQATISVTPETIETGGGWPLTTILLIVIPIVIVAIVVVLIKLRIIEISSREEET